MAYAVHDIYSSLEITVSYIQISIYLFICICTHTHKYVCVCRHTHTHTHVFTCIYVCGYVNVCVQPLQALELPDPARPGVDSLRGTEKELDAGRDTQNHSYSLSAGTRMLLSQGHQRLSRELPSAPSERARTVLMTREEAKRSDRTLAGRGRAGWQASEGATVTVEEDGQTRGEHMPPTRGHGRSPSRARAHSASPPAARVNMPGLSAQLVFDQGVCGGTGVVCV